VKTTREQFLADYLRDSGFLESRICDDGFEVDGKCFIVKPCACEYPECRGWIVNFETTQPSTKEASEK
jgi:hypothetical protein